MIVSENEYNMNKKLKVGVASHDLKFFKDILNVFRDNFIVKNLTTPRRKIPVYYEIVLKTKLKFLMSWSDVLFFEWAAEPLMLGTQLRKNSKIITRLHRFEFFVWSHKINWDKVDKIIFVAEHMRKTFLEKYPNMESRTQVIYNGVDLEKFKPLGERNFEGKLGILGNIIERKRVYDLILSFYDIQKENSELTLHIAGKGSGEYFFFVKDLIRKLDLQDKVFLYGFVDDIVDWYNSIDIYITNSMHEGMQVSLLEASACGCYPFSHFWNGVDEILPIEQIYITDHELKEKVLDYCSWSDGKRRSCINALRKNIESRFNVKSQEKMFLEAVLEIVKN